MGMDSGSSKGQQKGRAAPSMNVTPLVDVVLVLLIIFMVVTPLLARQFWIHLPDRKGNDKREPAQPPKDDGPIVVTVTERGDIKINRDLVPASQFPSKLRRVLAAKGERTVFFDAADGADYGRAAEVLDMARGGGAAKIAVLTERLPSK